MKNIHVIPTDKSSTLVFDTVDKKLYYSDTLFQKTVNVLPQNLYITSDEDIMMGDWYLYCNQIKKRIRQNNKAKYIYPNYQKIILTTDKTLIALGVQAIDKKFLE